MALFFSINCWHWYKMEFNGTFIGPVCRRSSFVFKLSNFHSFTYPTCNIQAQIKKKIIREEGAGPVIPILISEVMLILNPKSPHPLATSDQLFWLTEHDDVREVVRVESIQPLVIHMSGTHAVALDDVRRLLGTGGRTHHRTHPRGARYTTLSTLLCGVRRERS